MSIEKSAGVAIGNFEQPILSIGDPESFEVVWTAIQGSFSSGHVADFLRSLARSSIRIRDFERVLRQGLLGQTTTAEYGRLGDADQGQLREYYLASLERVPEDLRRRFLKLYAYY